jgi:hypothetical protein
MILDFITDEYSSVYEECNDSPELWDVLYKLYKEDIDSYATVNNTSFEEIKKLSRKEFDVFFDDALMFSTDEGEILVNILNYVEKDFLVFYNAVYDYEGSFVKVEKFRLAYTTFSENELSELVIKYLKYHNITLEQFIVRITQHLI